MASTYPLEVVQADRFAKQNASLKGEPLTKALESQSWDPSVKSLVNFPQVLTMMSEKLEWTQKLGDAFLAQQKPVMDTIQSLRAKAQAAGNLKTTKEQTVIVEEKIIKIEPASPQVSTCRPTIPRWLRRLPYPTYPPYPISARICSWVDVCVGAGVRHGRGVGLCWGTPTGAAEMSMSMSIGTHINNNISRPSQAENSGRWTDQPKGSGKWQHNPENRKGVSTVIKGRHRSPIAQCTMTRSNRGEQFRGRDDSGRQILARCGLGRSRGAGDRGGAGQIGGGNRPGTADRAVQANSAVGANRGGSGSRGGWRL